MPKIRKKSATRKTQQRLFILCEGQKDKSESAYFKSFIKDCRFAGDRVEVVVIDTIKNTGRELVHEAIEHREYKHDIAWVVYDKDGYTKHAETFQKAHKNNIKIAFSSISFEYWILLHFEFTSKSFSKSDKLISYIKQKHSFDYDKSIKDLYSITKSKINIAKQNAQKIQNYQEKSNPIGTPIYQYNPYTNIDILISEIEMMQSQ